MLYIISFILWKISVTYNSDIVNTIMIDFIYCALSKMGYSMMHDYT